MSYALTFYSDHLVPKNSAGCVRVFLVPIIFIRPAYRGDGGLLAHEEAHVDQAWGTLFPPLHAMLYALSKKYRLQCEVEAYRIQLMNNPSVCPDYSERYAGFIFNDYDLDISYEEALELLKK